MLFLPVVFVLMRPSTITSMRVAGMVRASRLTRSARVSSVTGTIAAMLWLDAVSVISARGSRERTAAAMTAKARRVTRARPANKNQLRRGKKRRSEFGTK